MITTAKHPITASSKHPITEADIYMIGTSSWNDNHFTNMLAEVLLQHCYSSTLWHGTELVNNLISVGFERHPSFVVSLLGDNALMEKLWQNLIAAKAPYTIGVGFVRLQWCSWLWIEYDALLLHNFLDILQDLYVEDLNETISTLPCRRLQESNGEMYIIWYSRDKVHYHVGACKSRMVKCTAFGYSRDKAMMSSSVRRTSDEALCILAWQLPRVAAMADTGLMEACLPHESCSFGRRTISARNITRYFQDMPFPVIQNLTEVVNYAGAVLEASNVDLSRLCLGAATVANKEVDAYNMVSNQFVQDHFHMPSLVAYDSPELPESSSRSVHRKRTPLDDPRTS
ncbi:hypothetical protein Tco_0323112 [Tanacetum coccineum]